MKVEAYQCRFCKNLHLKEYDYLECERTCEINYKEQELADMMKSIN